MKILILGSNGFVAKSLRGYLKTKKVKFKSVSKKQINFLKNNSSTKLKNITKNLKNYTLVIISAIAPAKNIDDYHKNIIIIKNIIKSLKSENIKKIIYISSDAVYSDTKKKITENSKTNPSSIHGAMHLHREKLLKIFYSLKKITILRPTLIYGKNDTHNSYGPNKFIRLAIKKQTINLFGKGEERRDHIHISDLIKIIYQSIINNYIYGTFNVVSGKTYSFKKIAEKAFKISKNKLKIEFLERNGPMPHLGLRQFENKKLKKNFKNLKFSNIDQSLKEYL